MNNRALFYHFLVHTSQAPMAIEIESAQGIYLWGPGRKKYLDLISGISVSNVGHSHPEIVQAVQQQAEKYMHLMVYGEFIQAPQVQLAQLLTANLPKTLNNVYLVNSGSEAVEGAMKLAKRHTGRNEIIAFKNAYHGSTQGALSVMGNESMKNAFRPLLPGVHFLEYDKMEALDAINSQTACVIMETIQGEAGAIVPGKEFIKAVFDQCKAHGALLIMDEIQAGFARTGSLWAFEHFGVSPDILLLAKGMGGGMPIGAFIASKEIMQSLTHSPVLGHITTFGGNAVCAAAALANLKIIVNNHLWENAARQERLIREMLVHPKIKSIRGKGLLLALEFQSFEENKLIIDTLVQQGIITDWFLFAPHCLRIAPPLIISEEEVIFACETILKVLKRLYG